MVLYERYTVGDDTSYAILITDWEAQTFTVGNIGTNENHNITRVKLKLYRVGNPGTITASIRAVEDHKPTGGDLSTGTTDGDTLTVDTGGEWREISMTSYELLADTEYAIVVRAPDAEIDNSVNWRADGSSPAYDGGNAAWSGNSGVDWTASVVDDYMFEEYGEPSANPLIGKPLISPMMVSKVIIR